MKSFITVTFVASKFAVGHNTSILLFVADVADEHALSPLAKRTTSILYCLIPHMTKATSFKTSDVPIVCKCITNTDLASTTFAVHWFLTNLTNLFALCILAWVHWSCFL